MTYLKIIYKAPIWNLKLLTSILVNVVVVFYLQRICCFDTFVWRYKEHKELFPSHVGQAIYNIDGEKRDVKTLHSWSQQSHAGTPFKMHKCN